MLTGSNKNLLMLLNLERSSYIYLFGIQWVSIIEFLKQSVLKVLMESPVNFGCVSYECHASARLLIQGDPVRMNIDIQNYSI